MHHLYRLLVLLGLFSLLAPAHAALVGKELAYAAGDTTLKGYLVYDDAIKGKRPGVLVVHEWWGHNEYARKRANMLAELGYVAFALDMYGEGKQAAHPEDARAFSSAVRKDWPLTQARFNAGLDVLRNSANTDPEHLAAVGYCFGGGIVLDMARAGVELDAVASFHGSLNSQLEVKPGQIKARVLVLNGMADPMVKPEHVTAFESGMKAAGVDYKIEHYEGARHAFTNPAADDYGKKFGLPLAYDSKADQQSWAAMKDFLKASFK